MVKEPRERELAREDIYAEYFRRNMMGKECVTEDFYRKMQEVE